MKKTIFTRFAAATLILAAVACQKENFEGDNAPQTQENLVPMTITASLEAGTKAALQEGGKVFWESGDALTVLAVEDGKASSYDFSTTGSGEKAEFTGMVGEGTINLSEGMYAVYPPTTKEYHPYIYGTSYSGFTHTVSSGSLQMFLPSTQFAAQDASGLYSLSAGKAELDEEQNIRLTMKNVGGLIAVTLPDQDITSVTLYGNANEQIAGVVTATFDENGIPVVSSVEGSNMIRIVPKKEGTFAAGTYYINVPPMTFESGLTLVFTDKESSYATLKSTSAFVVERSMVSSFPAIATLNFGGKYLDWTYSNDYTVASGVSVTIRYCSGDDGKYDDTLPNTGSNMKGTWDAMSHPTNGYKIRLKASSWIRGNTGTSGGLCLCGGAGAYVAFPSIEGYVLNKVSVRSGNMPGVYNAAGQCMTTTPDADGNYQILSGCSPVDYAVYSGMDNMWSFNGDTYTGELPISLTMTQPTHPNNGVRMHAIRLYYAKAAEGRPSVNPLITNVENLEPEVDYTNNKITMHGAFSAVDYSSISQFTCGFDYKLSSDSEWTSVSAEEAAFEFTKEVTLDTRGEYTYKSWVKFIKTNGSEKVVYGDESRFDMSRIVLKMVFDDSYYKDGEVYHDGNFLSREWGWKTNQNNSSYLRSDIDTEKGETMNNKTYFFNHHGNEFPFTFFSVQKADYIASDKTTKTYYGGYTLRVVSGNKSTYGLCMCYLNPNNNYILDSFPAWIQMPGVEKFKLVNIKGKQYKKFKFTITEQVDENTGALSGHELASSGDSADYDVTLLGSQAGQRYYLCTTGTWDCVFRNMTLTYEYAGN